MCLYLCHRWLQRPFPHCPPSRTTQPFFFLPRSLESSRSIRPPTLPGFEEVSRHRATHQHPEAVPTAGERHVPTRQPRPPPRLPTAPARTHRGRQELVQPRGVGGCLNARAQHRVFLNLELTENRSPHSGLRFPAAKPHISLFLHNTPACRDATCLGFPRPESISSHRQQPHQPVPPGPGPAALSWEGATSI